MEIANTVKKIIDSPCFEEVFNTFEPKTIYYVVNELVKQNEKINYNKLVYYLIEHQYLDLVEKNIKYFMNDNIYLMNLKNILNYTGLNEKYLNKYINENHGRIIDEILESAALKINIKNNKTQTKKNIQKWIDRLVIYENISYSDIKLKGEGGFSNAYQIGSKILKIGSKRKTFKMKNNKRFLQPVVREEIYDNNNFSYCLEITELVDTNDITEEDVYLIYKELRDQDLIWADPDTSNLGILLKENLVYYDLPDENNYGKEDATP